MSGESIFVNPNQERLKERAKGIYQTTGDMRDEYLRDYTRILHSNAYRRLKHKTQVFYNIDNDHVCTRMEHVQHVESVSHSIALGLKLDLELTRAIACGHDVGHAPFGHQGETILSDLLKGNLSEDYRAEHYPRDCKKFFWHEQNGLRFVDHIELLPDPMGIQRNLNLTYAVRDGILSHCGEVDENGLKPREAYLRLEDFQRPGQYMPGTWEGCVVKISDKIAYLGRDIEDAITLHFLTEEAKQKLRELGERYVQRKTLNTTGIMHSLIIDICQNSSPEKGICLSDDKRELLDVIKAFNYENIYLSKQFDTYIKYSRLVLESIFEKLLEGYEGEDTLLRLEKDFGRLYPRMIKEFIEYLAKYCDGAMAEEYCESARADGKGDESWSKDFVEELKGKRGEWENEKIYGKLESRDLYVRAIVDFISGMTDAYAISVFNELISFF